MGCPCRHMGFPHLATKISVYRFLLLCGVFGTPIFLLGLFVFGLGYPGYDHFNQAISELGAIDSPVKALVNIFVFNLFGVFIALFSLGIFQSKEIGRIGKIGSLFFFAAGFVMFFVGIFYNDAIETPLTARGDLHIKAAFYPFPIMTVGFLLFAFDIMAHKKLGWLVFPIIVVGPIALILRYLSAQFPYPFFVGVLQRAAIVLPFLIMTAIAMALYRLETKKTLVLFSAAIAIAATGAVGMYLNGDGSSVKAGIPYLCSSEQSCRDYCATHRGRCQSTCDKYPASAVCRALSF